MPRLIVVKGKDKGLKVDLEPGRPVRVGRRSDNDLPLNDSSLSRHHCEFLFDGTEVTLSDLGSRHGTYVNSRPVETRVLRDRDEVRLGKSRIRFVADEPDEASSAATDVEEPLLPEEEEKTEKEIDPPAPSEAPPDDESEEKTLPASDAPSRLPEFRPRGPEVDSDESGLLKIPPDQQRRRTLMTMAAVTAVVVLVSLGTVLVTALTGQPKTPQPVPMAQLPGIGIEVTQTRLLIRQPPTYIIDLRIQNKAEQPTKVRYKDFIGVDRVGIAYLPLDPTSESDLRTAVIEPGRALECSLNYELNMGSELARIVFQNRGFVVVE